MLKIFTKVFVVTAILFAFTTLFTTPTHAALVDYAQCSGPDCGTCEVIKLANGLITWLITIIFLLFAVLLMRAGVKLVVSGGNPSAYQGAKDNFINALIGLLIILAAWLIVDTLMKALVGSTEKPGQLKLASGQSTGWLLWSEITCTKQEKANECTKEKGCVEEVELEDQREFDADGNPIDPFVPGSPGDAGGLRGSGYTLAIKGGGSVTVQNGNTADIRSIPFLGHRVEIHKNLVPSLQRIDQRWRSLGGNNYYRVVSVGGFRSNDPKCHGYGLALDINPDQNPHCKSNNPDPRWPQCNGQNVLITNMDQVPPGKPHFYTLFDDEGWGWGGRWRSSKDAMHFSKCINEQGNMVGDPV